MIDDSKLLFVPLITCVPPKVTEGVAPVGAVGSFKVKSMELNDEVLFAIATPSI